MYNKVISLCEDIKIIEDSNLDNKIGIYFLINMITNEVYVGQSVNKNRRYAEHLWYSENYTGEPFSKLYQSVNKYGLSNFKYYNGIPTSIERLNDREIYFISKLDSYKNGLNMTEGGHLGGHISLLTDEQVIEVKEMLSLNKSSQRRIALEFGISYDIVSNINRGETHRHIGRGIYTYPIRINDNPHIHNTCADCGKRIISKAERCQSCSRIGERGTNAKLTEKEVKLIIDKLIENKTSIIDISELFNVSATTISNINNGYTWKYLTQNIEIPVKPLEVTRCTKCQTIISKNTLKCRSCHREGESNPMSKLTEYEVLEIIEMIRTTEITYEDIGAKFGVAGGSISKINNGTAGNI